jgi:hypothetical protein
MEDDSDEEEHVTQEAIARGEEPVCTLFSPAPGISDANYRDADVKKSPRLRIFMGTSAMF